MPISNGWSRPRTSGLSNGPVFANGAWPPPGKPAPIWRVKAAERALKAAGVSATDLDLVLLATCTGDYPIPATACLIQHRLGATRAAACDLSAACCGFVYALSVADAYVKTGMRHVLIVGSEVMSAIIDWTDRNTCILFGDGAGRRSSARVRTTGESCRRIFVPMARSAISLRCLGEDHVCRLPKRWWRSGCSISR